MRIVWTLASERGGGIPIECIFLEGQRLHFPGWRWVPRSLLTLNKGILDPGTRFIRLV